MSHSKYILGIDEAGRGSLAGPVYVAGVLLPEYYTNEKIKDSKLLKPEKREFAYSIIKEYSLFYQFYHLSNIVIDHLGISKSIYLLMNQIYLDVKKLFPELKIITIIDGNYNPIKEDYTYSIIKADSKITAVSAASIVAKVERDLYMKNIAKYISEYDFNIHKGYGTKSHISKILRYGNSIIHRRSFVLSEKAKKYAGS